MKPKIKKFNWLVKLITFNWPLAITLAPFGIYVNQKYRTLETVSDETKNHEKIHWKQQMEFIVVGLILSLLASLMFIWVSFHWWIIPILAIFPFLFFYLWYLLEWLIRIPVCGKSAYVSLSFEQEAYGNADNPNYLDNKKWFRWVKYLNKKWGVKY